MNAFITFARSGVERKDLILAMFGGLDDFINVLVEGEVRVKGYSQVFDSGSEIGG